MKKISGEDKAGLYFTLILHLAILIVLLSGGLGYALSGEHSFVIDFSQQEEMEKIQEELERLQAEMEFKEAISRKLQEELAGAPSIPSNNSRSSSNIRNIAVNRSALKDDRGTDAEKLYADAQRLNRELMEGRHSIGQEDFSMAATEVNKAPESVTEYSSTYSGPSVLAYELEGRRATHTPIPAYRCIGSGEVKVLITVNPSGKVIDAKIDNSESSSDRCLRDFALRAAKASLFSAKQGAAPKEYGYIIYQFVAQ